MTRVAAIDCGTNSIRLLIAEEVLGDDGCARVTDLVREMRIVRLGQGVDRTGLLAAEAIERGIVALLEYRDLIDAYGVEVSDIRFVATSAMRDAENRHLFINAVRDILGVDVEVIPGTEEAELSFTGAVSALNTDVQRPVMVVDIGGGSTEIIVGNSGVDAAISMDMGSVRVTEKFFGGIVPGDPEFDDAVRAAEQWIDSLLDKADRTVNFSQVATLLGVAGTVTTITAHAVGLHDYQPERIHGAVLSTDQHRSASDFMIYSPVEVKAALGFMPEGRADVIGGGALIWKRIIARFEVRMCETGQVLDSVLTSEHDILDGIALSVLRRRSQDV